MSSSSIVLHHAKFQLESAARSLSEILGIKLSKAKEHHAKALGFKSFNSALFKLRYNSSICVYSEIYLSILNESIQGKHKRALTEEQCSQISYKLCTSLSALYQSISFEQFFRYSIIKSAQKMPLISDAELIRSVHKGNANDVDANNLLFKYLETGEADSELINLIDGVLKFCRTQMNLKISSDWSGWTGDRYEKKKLLAQFKEAIDKYLTGDIYHIYYLPMVCRSEFITDNFSFQEANVDGVAFNQMRSDLQNSGRNAFFGFDFQYLNQCFYDAKKSVGDDYDYESSYFGYSSPLSKFMSGDMAPGIIEDIKSVPAGEFEFDSPLYIRFWNARENESLEDIVSENLWELYDYSAEEKTSEIFVQAFVIEGNELSKVEIEKYSKDFINVCNINLDNCYYGKLIKVNHSSRDDVCRLIGEAISSVLKRDKDAVAFLFNSSNSLYAIDREHITMPFGRATSKLAGFADCFIYSGIDFNDYDLTINESIIKIGKHSGYNQKPLHTLSNNLVPFEYAKINHDDVSHILDDGYLEETDCVIEYETFHNLKEFVKKLPFEKCRNVYIISCDRGSLDEPILFVGFDHSGIQVLNANLYLSDPYYSDKTWSDFENILRDIRLTISGFFEQWSIEFGYPVFGDDIMIDPCCNEIGFLERHRFFKYDPSSQLDPQESCLSKAYVSIPIGMSIKEAELELRKKLPCIENGTGHRYIKIEDEISTPYFMSSDEGRKWYLAKSTSEINRSYLPIQRYDVKDTEISIFQETRDGMLGNSRKEIESIMKNGASDHLGYSLYRPIYVSFIAQNESVAAKYEGQYEIISNIPVNDLAEFLNGKSDDELITLDC